jgi:hypothetical protein
MQRALEFEGEVDLNLDGTPAKLLGRREGLSLRVTHLSDLRSLVGASRREAPMTQLVRQLLEVAERGAFTISVTVGSIDCVEMGSKVKTDWLSRILFVVPVHVHWGRILSLYLSTSRHRA